MEPGASVARVARKHGINANQVFGWKRLYETGRLGAPASGITLLPVRVAEELAVAKDIPAEALRIVRRCFSESTQTLSESKVHNRPFAMIAGRLYP